MSNAHEMMATSIIDDFYILKIGCSPDDAAYRDAEHTLPIIEFPEYNEKSSYAHRLAADTSVGAELPLIIMSMADLRS